MLNEQTLNQLRALRLDGMVAALSDAATHITASELPFEQRLALLVQREVDWRDSKRLERLLKAARLKVSSACLEDIDWRASRGLSREVITSQLPVTAWHAWLDEPTLADAILDRIVHGSHKIALKGESMRKLTKAV